MDVEPSPVTHIPASCRGRADLNNNRKSKREKIHRLASQEEALQLCESDLFVDRADYCRGVFATLAASCQDLSSPFSNLRFYIK